jgi:hypothetical protein
MDLEYYGDEFGGVEYHPGEWFPSPGSCEQRRLAPSGSNQTTAEPFFGVCRLTVEPCRWEAQNWQPMYRNLQSGLEY